MKSRIVQTIYNLKLKQQRQSLLGRLNNRLVNFIFNYIKVENPLVETFIGKFKLKVPFSHELPFILKVYPYYSMNLARITKLVSGKYADLKLIDVGANIGDSVALIRSIAPFPILCIEGNNYFYSILQQNVSQFKDVYMSKTYAGELGGSINANPVESGGTAHINHDDSGTNSITIKKLSSILVDYPLFKTAKMIKIDTDGFDNKIIRGAIDFLVEAKPIIFFEYDPYFLAQQEDNYISIFDTLINIGYQNLLIYENYGELMISANLCDKRLLEDINHFFTGRRGGKYCDICAFHEEDNNLFDIIRTSEIAFYKQVRSNKEDY